MDERWTIDELRDLAALALDAADYNGQRSSRVRETPDKRAIRYYTTLGLLDRPAEFRGRTAYYGRRHVLQLAAIKRLQAKGMSLVEIQQSLAGADDRRLARWAGVPNTFWEQHRPPSPSPPDPDTLFQQEAPPEEKPQPRAAAFWRMAPAIAAAEAPISELADNTGEPRLAARPSVVLSLAPGVTLLLETEEPYQLDERQLAELAPAAEKLVQQLRRLRLMR